MCYIIINNLIFIIIGFLFEEVKKMTDYKTMYLKLADATETAIDILCKAQILSEDVYISSFEGDSAEDCDSTARSCESVISNAEK